MTDVCNSLTRLTGSIYRSTQAYINEVFEKYELASGTYPYLLILFHNEGINQNQVSRELDVDKAMSARAIKKLIDLGYIRKESDQTDSRAYNLFLTEKAKVMIPVIKAELKNWNDIVTHSLSEEQKEDLIKLLGIVLKDTKDYRTKQKGED